MKKFSILIIAILLLLCSCTPNTKYWKFEKDSSDVTEIKIVDITASDGYLCYESYVVIKELDISCVEELYADIESIEMKQYGTNLRNPRGKCFMIVFSNGEFDLISSVESKRFRFDNDGEKLQDHNSWLKCEEEQFHLLISKYMECQ